MKTIAIIHYGTILEDNGFYTNHQFYNILQESIMHYNTIFVGTKELDSSTFYIEGSKIYNYKISDKVAIKFLNQASSYTIIKKSMNLFKNINILTQIIKNTDKVLIFVPGYTGLIASLLSLYYKKELNLYVGANWDDISKFQIKKTFNIISVLYKRSYFFIEKIVVKRADMIITAGKQLFSIYSKYNNNVFETKPMLNISNNENSVSKSHENENSLLYVGSVQERKGLINIVDAINILKKENIEIILTIIGHADSSYKDIITIKVNKLGLQHNVLFKNYISDANTLKKYYNSANMFIIPTFGEGFPRVIYEAMLNKLPVLASNIDAIKENLPNDDCLLFFENNPIDISNKIKFLISNSKIKDKITNNGYNFAKNKVGSDNPYKYLFELINNEKK